MRSQQFKDFYAVLGVAPDVAASDIKTAYQEAVRFYHPDQHGNSAYASSKMQAVNEAYEVLKDKQKREEYDTVHTSRMNNGSSATYSNTATQSPLEKAVNESQWLFTLYGVAESGSSEEAELLQKMFISLNKIVEGWPESEAALHAQQEIVSLLRYEGKDHDKLIDAARKLGRMSNTDEYKNIAAYHIAVGYSRQDKDDKALPLLESLISRSAEPSDFLGDCLCAVVLVHIKQNNIMLAKQTLERLQHDIPDYSDQTDVQFLAKWIEELSAPVDPDLQQILMKCEFAKEALVDADNGTGEDKTQNVVEKRRILVSLLRSIVKKWHGKEAAIIAQKEIVETYLSYGTDYNNARQEAETLQRISDELYDKHLARVYIGLAFRLERKFDESLEVYNNLLLDPDIKSNDHIYGTTLYEKGMVYAVQDKHGLTVKVFDKLLEELPEHQDVGDAKRRRDLHQGVINSTSTSGSGCMVLLFLSGGAGATLLSANWVGEWLGFVAIHISLWAKSLS